MELHTLQELVTDLAKENTQERCVHCITMETVQSVMTITKVSVA